MVEDYCQWIKLILLVIYSLHLRKSCSDLFTPNRIDNTTPDNRQSESRNTKQEKIAAVHVGNQQPDIWWNSSCICGAKAAVHVGEQQQYFWQVDMWSKSSYTVHISCINTGKAALHMGKQQQYIVGKAASHVGKTVAVCMWKSSCACGKTAAVYMWEKQLYMWENRTCTERTYILYVHKEWCAGISSLIHLWESSSCQSGKIQLCMSGNSSSVLGKSSCKWYKKQQFYWK